MLTVEAGQPMKERKELFVKTNNALSHRISGAIVASNIINGKIYKQKRSSLLSNFLRKVISKHRMDCQGSEREITFSNNILLKNKRPLSETENGK